MWLDGKPTIIVEHGRPKMDVMTLARVDEQDVLTAARETQGLERMDQIKYAVLETSGGDDYIPLTILPLSASMRSSRDSLPVSMISMS